MLGRRKLDIKSESRESGSGFFRCAESLPQYGISDPTAILLEGRMLPVFRLYLATPTHSVNLRRA